MSGAYLTVGRDCAVEIEARRSRFRATVRRVEDERAAREVVAGLRREHPDAGHHCSAFVLGADRTIERSHDDGEPAGTAGTPMLQVLRGREVADVVVVVTRWFGGTLLGSGGLIRAYGEAARAGLTEAGVRRRTLLREHLLEVSHADAGRLESDLRNHDVPVLDTEYVDVVRLRLGARIGEQAALHALVADLTGGGSTLREAGDRWVDGPILTA